MEKYSEDFELFDSETLAYNLMDTAIDYND